MLWEVGRMAKSEAQGKSQRAALSRRQRFHRAGNMGLMSPLPTSRRSFLRTTTRIVTTAAAAWASPRFIHASAPKEPWRTGNDVIDRSRETALGLLGATAAQLERGLALHSASVVFDSYGFAPRAAIDAAEFNETIRAGASASELNDLREEMSMVRMALDEREKREFLDAFRAAGVTCIFQNAGEEGNDPLRLLKRLSRFTYATDLLRPHLSKAVRPSDIEATKRADQHCLYLTGNGVPLSMKWESVRDELRFIRVFRDLGIRMMHATYNRRNPIGDGAGEPKDGGLSDFGVAAVAEMNRMGVIVDVAHSGWKTAFDAAKASAKPMVASHTTAAGLYRHFRGKPDDTIKAICDTGGLVGICCIARFLGGKGDITALLDHIDYVAKKFGVDHVAIGTDVSYVSRFDREERAKVIKRADGSSALGSGPKWEHLWPKDDYQATPEAELSLAWTNWPLFTVGLVQRGYKDDEIARILGGNMLRVAKANFTA
jgi:membrane dipeptidase